jgi:translation initiation factor IF-1
MVADVAIAINRRITFHGGVRVNRTPPFLFSPMKEEHIEVEGSVTTVLPGTMFRVELDNKHLVLATISGKMRKRFVRLTVGDRVKMEMSPYDLDKARIVWRLH